MLKCVIAEDETLLRDALVLLLGEVWPELEIVAACDDGGSALEAIAQHQPQVAFLDIRMPGLTGLEVAAALPQASSTSNPMPSADSVPYTDQPTIASGSSVMRRKLTLRGKVCASPAHSKTAKMTHTHLGVFVKI